MKRHNKRNLIILLSFTLICTLFVVQHVQAEFMTNPFTDLVWFNCNDTRCFMGLKTANIPNQLLDSIDWIEDHRIYEYTNNLNIKYNYTLITLDAQNLDDQQIAVASRFYSDAPSLSMLYHHNDLRADYKQLTPLCIRKYDNSGMCEVVAVGNQVYCQDSDFCR